MTAVGFEPTQLALVELEPTPLDHSGKLSWGSQRVGNRGASREGRKPGTGAARDGLCDRSGVLVAATAEQRTKPRRGRGPKASRQARAAREHAAAAEAGARCGERLIACPPTRKTQATGQRSACRRRLAAFPPIVHCKLPAAPAWPLPPTTGEEKLRPSFASCSSSPTCQQTHPPAPRSRELLTVPGCTWPATCRGRLGAAATDALLQIAYRCLPPIALACPSLPQRAPARQRGPRLDSAST